MTREEKQKAIDALKISVPIMAITQEEFADYIQTLNKIMDWLEQEPFINKPCVSSGVCEHDKNVVLDKIRAEILDNAFSVVNPKNTYEYINVLDLDSIEKILDKYKTESEDKAW